MHAFVVKTVHPGKAVSVAWFQHEDIALQLTVSPTHAYSVSIDGALLHEPTPVEDVWNEQINKKIITNYDTK